jgi:hypothetical protein
MAQETTACEWGIGCGDERSYAPTRWRWLPDGRALLRPLRDNRAKEVEFKATCDSRARKSEQPSEAAAGSAIDQAIRDYWRAERRWPLLKKGGRQC